MTKSQGIGIGVILAVIGGAVASLVVKSQTPPASRIVLSSSPDRKIASGTMPVARSQASSGTNSSAASSAPDVSPASETAEPPAPSKPPEIVVQVAGAVHKPGVYHLKPDARNDDALKAAGGPTADANTASVNLAARAQDGSQIYIKTTKEQPTGGASEEAITVAVTNSPVKKSESAHATGPKASGKKGDTGSKPAKLTSPSQGKININTASAEELERIPGIGPSMAERLIAYRQENHGFQSVEDLMQVSGIGEKKFARMQPFVKAH